MKNLKLILTLIVMLILPLSANSEEKTNVVNEHELNFYTGMFDFSDEGQ